MKIQIQVAALRHKHTKRLVDACVIEDNESEVAFNLEKIKDEDWIDYCGLRAYELDCEKEIKHHEQEVGGYEITYEIHEIEIK